MLYHYHHNAIHISKIDLLVTDLSVSKKFYTENLGFSVLNETDEYISLTVDHQNEFLRLIQNTDDSPMNNSMNIYHFAILLPTRKDLGIFLRHLILKQIPIDGAADHLVSEAIYLQDPDGFGIEICVDKDDSTWSKNDKQIEMDTLPFDYKGVYYAADDDDFFVSLPTDTIIGHLHLQVKNIQEIKDFYSNVIGFDIVNDKIKDAVFMSDNNYHHHLAINTWGNRSHFNNRLKSFTIAFPNCEKFIEAYDKIKQMDLYYEETNQGILVRDPEETEVLLSIK
jgi:catechol 2,3-dioxygenase